MELQKKGSRLFSGISHIAVPDIEGSSAVV